MIRDHHGRLDGRDGAQRELLSARTAAYIKKVVDAAPPLTEAQVDELSLIFRGARRSRAAAPKAGAA